MSQRKQKKKTDAPVARVFTPEARLKRRIRLHFTRLGFAKAPDGTLVRPDAGKESVRQLHRMQRDERVRSADRLLSEFLPEALPHFANGNEIDASKIRLSLIRVEASTFESNLFRTASLTWSVPVSNGYGRRLRYLVWDEAHNRLAGIFALGDPVFNLSVRDNLIGWKASDRSSRLVNILDAYVLGAVPPYNMLLAGKAIACLVRSRDVYDDFALSYGSTTGIISGEEKRARLLAVTTSSSMGRSSLYNRLKLDGEQYYKSIGYTVGWGHFHITDDLFAQMREFLRLSEHPYADRHKYGQGPNWRLRTIRAALGQLGINESVLKHGIQREVFFCPLVKNAQCILATGKGHPDLSTLKTVEEISDLARARWMEPRANRRDEYKAWNRDDIPRLIRGELLAPEKRKAV
ncbi:Druantia anti-phage system protein DruA [Hyphobacterium sp.]|uniref:Druantia anti-phage system protein DruA n=1 Tax=Hyphobacterium sp. TaxID=2004662 RepID=UPI003748BF85